MASNLTSGNINKQIFSMFVPMLISVAVQQLYGITDMVIVGKFVSADAFAAVNCTSSFNSMVLSFILGFVNGCGILVSNAFGANKPRTMKRVIANGIYLVGFMAIVVTGMFLIFLNPVLHLLNTPSDVYSMAYSYIFIIILSYPFSIASNYLGSLFNAIGDTKTIVLRGAISTAINIILDLLFVVVFKWGVVGAAVATLVASFIYLVISVLMYLFLFRELHISKKYMKFDFSIIKESFMLGFPLGLTSCTTMLGCTLIQSCVNGLGTVYLTAFSAAGKVEYLLTVPIISYTSALRIFLSQNHGAKKVDRIFKAIKNSVLIATVYGLILSPVLRFFGDEMCLMYLNASETQAFELIRYYTSFTGTLFVLLCLLYIVRSTIQGLGYGKFIAIGGFIELATRVFVAFVLVDKFKFFAISISCPLSWILTVAFLSAALIFAVIPKLRKLRSEEIECQIQ